MKKIVTCFMAVILAGMAVMSCKPAEEAPKTDGLTAPVAGTDMFVTVDEMTVTFTYTGGEVARYRWKLSTGETFDTKDATFTFDEPGNYSVSLGIANEYDYTWSDSFKFTIEAPVIPLSKPVPGTDMTVTINGKTLTLGYTGEAATAFQWEISDGTVLTKRNNTYKFQDVGDYTVRLGVSDGGEFIWSDPVPVTAVLALIAGTRLYIGGEGVADVDKDHHMTYLPDIDYHADRDIAAHFSDNCAVKNDAGTWKETYHSDWSIYDYANNVWTSYFDYEIFVMLYAGKDIQLHDEDNTIYVALTSNTTGKGTVAYSDTPISFQVPKDGIYRIRFNSTSKESYLSTPNSIIIRCWPGPKNINIWDPGMDYPGHGVFSTTVDFSTQVTYNADGNMGYKFLFMGFDSDQPTGMQYIGAPYTAWDGKDVKYWSLVPVQGSAWNATAPNSNGTYDFPADLKNKSLKVNLYFNDQYGAYVHFFE